MNELKKGLYFSPADDDGANDKDDAEEKKKAAAKKEETPLEWDAFHGSLSKEAQELIVTRESGLKTALKTERDARSDAEADLRKVAKDLEEGSEAQKKVLELADDVASGNQKSDFYEDAHKAGVSNLKLAYHVATEEDLFDRKGMVDFDKLKKDYPELFGKKIVPDGSAGDGTGGKLPGKKKDMNAAIRAMAGRKT